VRTRGRCGDSNAEEDVELQGVLQRSPQENLEAMLEARDR